MRETLDVGEIIDHIIIMDHTEVEEEGEAVVGEEAVAEVRLYPNTLFLLENFC